MASSFFKVRSCTGVVASAVVGVDMVVDAPSAVSSLSLGVVEMTTCCGRLWSLSVSVEWDVGDLRAALVVWPDIKMVNKTIIVNINHRLVPIAVVRAMGIGIGWLVCLKARMSVLWSEQRVLAMFPIAREKTQCDELAQKYAFLCCIWTSWKLQLHVIWTVEM